MTMQRQRSHQKQRPRSRPGPEQNRDRGFTLVELMIAMTIGLLIFAGMTTLLVNNSRAQGEIAKANRQVENGRYAIQLLTGDLRNAGYYGEFDPTVLASPATLPDPCATALNELKVALPLHVQGGDANLACLEDVRSSTDVVVVRHAATCILGSANCDAIGAAGPYFQASLCNNASELGSGSSIDFYALGNDPADMTRHRRDCSALAGSGTPAALRRLETHIYFIANNHLDGDGIPTLKRAEVLANGNNIEIAIVPLVEGIENMQIEYGLDLDGDGISDANTPAPASHGGCVLAACAVANWRSVVSLKLSLLARNIERSSGYIDSTSYVLGSLADGSANTVAATGDHYRRHVFQAVVALSNPAGRSAP
jgi:type IV pilus assembly protein PilW